MPKLEMNYSHNSFYDVLNDRIWIVTPTATTPSKALIHQASTKNTALADIVSHSITNVTIFVLRGMLR